MNTATNLVGLEAKVLNWLKEKNLAHKSKTFERGPNTDYMITIPGINQIHVSLNIPMGIFKNRDLSAIGLGDYNINFTPSKNVTIISELRNNELYLKCKDLAQTVLNNCLGKTKKEQFIWIYDRKGSTDSEHWEKSNYVDDSEPFIRNMAKSPSPSDIKSFFEAVRGSNKGGTAGVLEYLIKSKPVIGEFFDEALVRAKG